MSRIRRFRVMKTAQRIFPATARVSGLSSSSALLRNAGRPKRIRAPRSSKRSNLEYCRACCSSKGSRVPHGVNHCMRKAKVADFVQEAARLDRLLDHGDEKLHEDSQIRTAIQNAAHAAKSQRLASFGVDFHEIDALLNDVVKTHRLDHRAADRADNRTPAFPRVANKLDSPDEFLQSVQVGSRLFVSHAASGWARTTDSSPFTWIFFVSTSNVRGLGSNAYTSAEAHGPTVPTDVAGSEQRVVAIVGSDVDNRHAWLEARDESVGNILFPIPIRNRDGASRSCPSLPDT